jgi:hypothetical protein
MWWGKRKRRGTQLSRLLALGRLQDAMGRVDEQHGSSDPVPYPADADRPADAPEQDAMLAADGLAGRTDQPPASEPAPDLKGQLPIQRRPARPAPRPAGPDSSAPSSPRSGGSGRDRLPC